MNAANRSQVRISKPVHNECSTTCTTYTRVFDFIALRAPLQFATFTPTCTTCTLQPSGSGSLIAQGALFPVSGVGLDRVNSVGLDQPMNLANVFTIKRKNPA